MSKILITGASGLIGTRLTEMLLHHGYEVVHLGRSRKTDSVPTFVWDVKRGTVEKNAFQDVDTVVHLAGANVSDKRWTASWKKEILESRTKSTALLARYIEKNQNVKTVISASAIGYYGFVAGDEEFTENSPAGKDFLASVVKAWEDEVDKIQHKRVVKLRIGIVLSEQGGALQEMAKPIRAGVGAPLGSGKQVIPWIHIDDVCRMFIHAIENNSLQGAYNATGPESVTNQELTKSIAQTLNKTLWLPAIPAFVLRLVVGEMAGIILSGAPVSSKKIQQTGFRFQFPDLHRALAQLLKK